MEGVLEKVAVLRGLSREDLAYLGVKLKERAFAKGETIFRRGDPGSTLHIIRSGRVKIVLGSEQGLEMVLAVLGPGEFYGELSLLDGEPRSADAVAMEEVSVYTLHRDDFLDFVASHPAAATAIMATLGQRLRRTDALIEDAAFLDVNARVAKRLLELAQEYGTAQGSKVEIGLRLTQQDIAGMVGASRESVGKVMAAYAKQGILSTSKGTLVLHQMERLHEIAEGP